MKRQNLEEKHTHCAHCRKKFRKNTEVATSNASGNRALLHIKCLSEYVLEWSEQDYYANHNEYLIENGLIDE